MSPTTLDGASGSRADQEVQAVQTALTGLAQEVGKHGLQAELKSPHGSMAYLIVRNPRASALTEKVYANHGVYYYSWWEPIADWDEAATAGAILGRVLRTVDGE
jgi:hypothetical protein